MLGLLIKVMCNLPKHGRSLFFSPFVFHELDSAHRFSFLFNPSRQPAHKPTLLLSHHQQTNNPFSVLTSGYNNPHNHHCTETITANNNYAKHSSKQKIYTNMDTSTSDTGSNKRHSRTTSSTSSYNILKGLSSLQTVPASRQASIKSHLLASESFVKRLEQQPQLKGHRGCVNTIAWDETGEFLVSGSGTHTLQHISQCSRLLLGCKLTLFPSSFPDR